MIAVTLSLLTAAPAAPKNASAPTPIADLHDWWDGSVAWVNSHWLQIGIAVAAGLPIYFLLSLLRTLALKRAQAAPGPFPLTDIGRRVGHKTAQIVLALLPIRLAAPYANTPAMSMRTIHHVSPA